MSHNLRCDKDCGNVVQLAMITAEMGDQKRIIMNLKRERDLLQSENQILKEKLLRFENGLAERTFAENDTPGASDNESTEVKTEIIAPSKIIPQSAFMTTIDKDESSISTPRKTKRERSHSDENDHTPARKKTQQQAEKNFQCSVDKNCLLSFTTKQDALKHARDIHSYNFGCEICSKAFKKKSNFNTHKSRD